MNSTPAALTTLGQAAKSARETLIDRISDADTASKALKAAIERATKELPEYVASQAARSAVVAARDAYDSAVTAYRAEQGIAK